MSRSTFHLILASLCATAIATLEDRDACTTGFQLCSPPGATSASSSTPQIGDPSFPTLFDDILLSKLPSSTSTPNRQISLTAVTTTSSLCCNTLISCLLMPNLLLPFCYDEFTTNYHLPDGSYGTAAFGTYTSSTSDTVNFETGAYTLANGTTGNIYTSNPAALAEFSSLTLPTQYTSSGIGSAVPVSSLGVEVTLTLTTTIPGTTIGPSTLPPTILPPSTVTETILYPTTITTTYSGATVTTVVAMTSLSAVPEPVSTVSGSVVPGSTRNSAVITFVTASEAGVGTSASASASTDATASPAKKSSAGRNLGKVWWLAFVGLAWGVGVV